MKKYIGIILGITVLTSVTFEASPVTPVLAANQNNNHIQVIICHATGSSTNPFTKIPVDDDAVDGNGNDNADHNRAGHQNGEDIIPPGSWDADGRNWTTQGQAIWNNNCNIPTNPTPTVTNTPTPTVTVSPTATPTPTTVVTPTVTPTPTGSSNQTTVTPTPTVTATPTVTDTPTPTPTTTTSVQGTSTSSSTETKSETTTGRVLGASAMAPTGTFVQNLMNAMYAFGMLSLVLGSILYAKTKKA